ncbi:hypothetical protein WJX72_007598 [[Myrmecia] bisecta]|uniref:DUF493 domain-containing protein n=1 Tax=[Myrmecia] bisecta TaxID=41462 RepID=A0AAW1Q895_9CHLO
MHWQLSNQARKAEFEGCSGQDLPPALQGLSLNDEGLLVDEKTGKVINEYGATRFDVAVRAIRGEFDPPSNIENTERNDGVILSSLISFPADYTFHVVARSAEVPANFAEELSATIARVCQTDPSSYKVSVKDRLNGKFVSVQIEARVPSADQVKQTYVELGRQHKVVMKF